MPKARFLLEFTALDEPGPEGLERGEFYLAANPGEKPKPLRQVASGGEISRIMLAMKATFAGADRIPTLVFDEIDAGIGGAVATKVASKMQSLAGIHIDRVDGCGCDHRYSRCNRCT